jgi:NAD-dependent dihydropyrimidine dehydrogenase PreA subunit/flavodoxin
MSNKTISIFYFSGTGNTWWISELLSKKLNGLKFQAKAYSIEQVNEKEIAGLVQASDIIGLGFPIYGSDVPRIFRDFLDRLPTLEKEKETLGFVTQMAWSGDGMNFLKNALFQKGYALKWSAEFNMPNNIALPIFPLPYSSNVDSFKPQLKQCEQQAETLCFKIAGNEPSLQHTGILAAMSAWVQRGPFRLVHDWGRRFWSVDAEACTACQRCARLCPVGNIEMRNGLPIYSDQCTYCMRCFNYCPTHAIHYLGMKNTRLERNPPFQGPSADFQPEMLIKK